MATFTRSQTKFDTQTTSQRLDQDERIISFIVMDPNGQALVSGGDLQTLVELLIQQTAQVVDSMGNSLFGSRARFFRLHSSYYSAFFLRQGNNRVGIIADNALTSEDLAKLIG